jgi:hypothetical protein
MNIANPKPRRGRQLGRRPRYAPKGGACALLAPILTSVGPFRWLEQGGNDATKFETVQTGEPAPLAESHSANTSCSVLKVAVSVFAETTPSFFASRVLSTARTSSSRIKPFRPP